MASKEPDVDNEWAKDNDKVRYSKYLQLDKITKAQRTTTKIHDEQLFVVIHQVYELWFKQLRCEIDSICDEFEKPKDTDFLVIVTRLDRIIKILKLLVEQIRILETMSPQDFLGFRGNLFPASGFQSYQFRIIEYRIGLNEDKRPEFDGKKEGYKKVMNEEELKEMNDEKQKKTLFAYVQEWLESLEDLEEFSRKYETAIKEMIEENKKSKGKAYDHKKEEDWYDTLINKSKHDEKVSKGDRRFSREAFFGALKIYLCRDEPQFYAPYQILNQLIEMDTLLMKWRYSHMFLVQYQIGNRSGTGGTDGVGYLEKTISKDLMVFPDLINMTSFFVLKKYMHPKP